MSIEGEDVDQKYLAGSAEIPEYQPEIDPEVEYRDFTEEKLWTPNEDVNAWIPFYMFMARAVLTFVQEKTGIPNKEAMENSCIGYAEQYVTDVLHDSEYSAEIALKTLVSKQLPNRLIAKWTQAEIELFSQGLARHGKNFSKIQKDVLTCKDTKEIVEFYYTWKRSESAKMFRSCRDRGHVYSRRSLLSTKLVAGDLSFSKVMTRSATAASKTSASDDNGIERTRLLRVVDSAETPSKRKRKRHSDPTPIR
ncbi:arginine-glutamic acid dipeptide repeats protein [Nomia melanderi]|uniref:arginine-glutamic acid dipeptide repeats protein n=1 Tax=Nomia melanderi TaxID=2448451 RepID=UPI001304608E|nr:arginine-glutamic acid dipeptide repeats protein-like [Nomia melanderi]